MVYQGADYPGVISYADSKAIMDRELGSDARSVRGVVVKGLTSGDFRRLDYFEGGASDTISPRARPLTL